MFLSRLPPRFDIALRDTSSERMEFRLEAAEALGRAVDDDDRRAARAALRPLLDDDVARIRAAALTALGFVGDDADVPALMRATRDPRKALRETAAMALARIGSPDARTALTGLLEAEEAELRFHAIAGLSVDLDEHLAPRVAALIDDADPFVRESAVAALASHRGFVAAHRSALIARLDDVPHVRLVAAHALALIGDPAAQPVLIDDIARGRPSAETLHAVVELRALEAAEPLRANMLRFIAPRRVRFESAAALAALGDAEALAFLTSKLTGYFLAPRLEILAFIGSFRVTAAAAAVAALAEKPRGVPTDVVAHTLERLDASPEAQRGLAILDAQRQPL